MYVRMGFCDVMTSYKILCPVLHLCTTHNILEEGIDVNIRILNKV